GFSLLCDGRPKPAPQGVRYPLPIVVTPRECPQSLAGSGIVLLHNNIRHNRPGRPGPNRRRANSFRHGKGHISYAAPVTPARVLARPRGLLTCPAWDRWTLT